MSKLNVEYLKCKMIDYLTVQVGSARTDDGRVTSHTLPVHVPRPEKKPANINPEFRIVVNLCAILTT